MTLLNLMCLFVCDKNQPSNAPELFFIRMASTTGFNSQRTADVAVLSVRHLSWLA